MWLFLLALNGNLHWIKNERISASNIQNTQFPWWLYQWILSTKKFVLPKKKIDLRLNNMRANYKNFNEEQRMALLWKFEKFNKKPFWFLWISKPFPRKRWRVSKKTFLALFDIRTQNLKYLKITIISSFVSIYFSRFSSVRGFCKKF